jgi:putative transposase
MLSDDTFAKWCQEQAVSEKTEKLLVHIRSSPPSRLVQSSAGNMSGRYPSKTMGCTIQFESHRNELPFIYELDHDPEVLEFYDQPGRIKLVYQGKNRRVGVLHTPDFFVIRFDEAGWVECKMEDRLFQLAEQMPHRYHRNRDGTWSCPPGEAYAESYGLFYRIRSSREINWTYFRNLRFLQEYLCGPRLDIPIDVVTEISTKVMRNPGIKLLDLLQSLHAGSADDVYFLIATDKLYVDLHHALLPEPERVQVFPDEGTASGKKK